MIHKDEMIADPQTDDLGGLRNRFQAIRGWITERRAIEVELTTALRNRKYKQFTGNYANYQLRRIGESYLYRVPLTKRGNFVPYSGKLIRLVCTGQNSFKRDFVVGVVDEIT